MNKIERTLIKIKKIKKTSFGAAKFNFKKCKDLCPSLAGMQEHMLEDRCCNYRDQTFTRRSHKKYMCKQYKITFSPSVELQINTHKQNILYGAYDRVIPCERSEKFFFSIFLDF